jgi:IS5 family transposase
VLLARMRELVSDEHFSVDGTLLEAWASHKSFRPRVGSGDDGDDFHGEKRSNDTHVSATDPDARLIRKGKGKEAKLSYLANALMENRHGLLVAVDVRHASGTGEREGALDLLTAAGVKVGATLGADKGYDTQDFVAALKQRGIRPHIARHTKGRRSAIDGRAARDKGYATSLRIRKRIEQSFGWIKTIGGLRKLPLVAMSKVRGWVTWTFAAYNLIRLGGIGEWWEPSPT